MPQRRHGISTRTAVMGLFGMMNWLYTWYKPQVDPDAEVLAREMSDIFCAESGGRSARPRRMRDVANSRNVPRVEEENQYVQRNSASPGKRQKLKARN